MPTVCPACGGKLVRKQNEAATRCRNKACPAQRLRKLIHYTSKAGMDIEGLGRKAMEQLVAEGLVTDIPDIYSLKEKDLAALDGWGELSAHNAVAAIKASKETTLAQFVRSLGIPYVGEEIALVLERHFAGSLPKLMQAGREELLEIEGIGDQIAAAITEEFFQKSENKELVTNILAQGVQLKSGQKTAVDAPLKNHVFLFTGSLASFSRDEAKARIKELGGQVTSSVNKKVTHVVVGEKPGSKLAKARDLGLQIIDEQTFKEIVRQPPQPGIIGTKQLSMF
jgi:DNA ligase (NAD+)